MENQKGANSGNEVDSKSNYKVKLMCSYGGKIQQRPHDHQLTYVGGETKILALHRRIKFSDILSKLISLSNSAAISLKYQLPGEDLDALVSVINDDDLEHMMAEYDRIHTLSSPSSKPARLRLFLFSSTPPLKSAPLNPDFLFGFDDEFQSHSTPKSEIIQPDFPASNMPNGAPIQGYETFSRVEGGGAGQLVYRLPVMAGGYQGGVGVGPYGMQAVKVVPGIVYREHPVYNFVPAALPEHKLGFSAEECRGINGMGLEDGGIAHVAIDDGGRSLVYNAVGAVSPHPTVTRPMTFTNDAKINI
ncbi:unnamed protein product [Camellia sinensis]